MPIYENLVIGNILFALGLKIGARQVGNLAPDLVVSLLQQTPLDIVLGDVLLTGPRAVALLEFKRAAARRSKERAKLMKIEAQLEHAEFRALRNISRQIHFYVETGDTLNKHFSRVLPYLDLRTDQRRSCLEHLVDDLAYRARSAHELPKTYIRDFQRYLELVCLSQSRSYPACPALLVGVGEDWGIAFAPVDDLLDLQTTIAAIQAQQIIREQEIIRAKIELTRQLRQGRVQSPSQTPRRRLTL